MWRTTLYSATRRLVQPSATQVHNSLCLSNAIPTRSGRWLIRGVKRRTNFSETESRSKHVPNDLDSSCQWLTIPMSAHCQTTLIVDSAAMSFFLRGSNDLQASDALVGSLDATYLAFRVLVNVFGGFLGNLCGGID